MFPGSAVIGYSKLGGGFILPQLWRKGWSHTDILQSHIFNLSFRSHIYIYYIKYIHKYINIYTQFP